MDQSVTDFNTLWIQGIGIFLVSTVSIIISLITWLKSTKKQDYANLDGVYQSTLQFGSTYYPHFMNPEITKLYPNIPFYDTEASYSKPDDEGPKTVPSIHERYRYDAYVLMVFSFYESVFDDVNDNAWWNKYLKSPVETKEKNLERRIKYFQTDLNWVSYFPSFKKDLKLHQTWYEYKDKENNDRQVNKEYFKKEFQDVIRLVMKGKIV
ncbi:MAG: hypothetical protein ACREA5_02440 [Nitrosotalea sp.]